MKKVLSSILISFIIFANLLAPFSVGWGKNGVEVKKNEARAEYTYSLDIKPTLGDKYIKLDVEVLEKSDTGDATDLGTISLNANLQVRATILKDGEKVDNDIAYLAAQVRKVTMTLDGGILSSLDPGTPYKTKIELVERLSTQTNAGTAGGSGSDTFKTLYETTIDTPTVKTGEQEVVTNKVGINGTSNTIKTPVSNSRDMPECGVTTPMGCVAQFFYYTIFVPTSYLFALSGTFFDTTFSYSVQDTSYRSVFVVQGWGLVRDICNLFFIFVLLYVAIGTTLSLHSMKTKETIINVVIIGLFINFSLFATQVIIDASNIAARVFYNSDAIKLEEQGANGVANATPGLTIGEDGVIPLSAGIVNKVNPQNIILKSKEINNVPDKGTASSTDKTNSNETTGNLSISSFILITFIASAINIVGLIVFLVVGMLFVTRIVGLWIAMILAPLAFFTYILPEQMAGIKMIGWKNWWPETLKLAFLAPVFMFFMYIILKFLSMDLISDIAGKSITQDGLGYFISILMPFAFIMVLLMKAKGIAKDMAGQMGEFATKMGSAVGGVALGGAVGLGAMAMRGTLGRLGSSVANSDTLKAREAAGGFRGFLAKNLRNVGTGASVASFDARNTKAGATANKELGIDMGKAKEGGFVKARADNVAARVKRANELELSEDSAQTQAVRQAEHALHAVKTDPDRQNTLLSLNNGIPFTEVQAAITAAQTNVTAAQAARNALPATALPGTAAAEDIRLADIAVKEAQAALVSARVADSGLGGLERAITAAERALGVEERKLKDAETALLAAKTPAQIQAAQTAVNNAKRDRNRAADIRDDAKNNKEARETTIRAQERPIHIAEDALARSQNEVIRTNNHIRHAYAESIQGAWSNAINGVISLGEHSALGEREAHYKILAGSHEEKKTAEHH